MFDDYVLVRIPLLKAPPLAQGDSGIDEEALAGAFRAMIDSLEQLTEAASVTNRYNTEIPLLVDELMDRAMGLAQATWLVDLDTSYRAPYSDLGHKRVAWAIDMENNKNKNHENDDQLCECAP